MSETLPTVCNNVDKWKKACEYATFYSSTVSLLPTHQTSTNKVVARNRRIGISIIDYSGWKLENGVHKVTKWMREGYKIIRKANAQFNDEAGIPHAIRVTTVKPGGTTPKLPGRTSGIGHPTFDFTLRRVRVAKNSPVHPLLVAAGVPMEEDIMDSYTDVFEWPIFQGPARPAYMVSLWEQAANLVLVQREWADNAVSNTLYFKPMWALADCITDDFSRNLEMYLGVVATHSAFNAPNGEYIVPERYKIKIKRLDTGTITEVLVYEYDPNHEEDYIEPVLSSLAPVTKSLTLLPHSVKGAYLQMPEEGLNEEEYYQRLTSITPINWKLLSGSDGIDERYCTGPVCELKQ